MPNTATSNQEKPDSLVVPNQLWPLDKEDYPEVLYWCKESWVKHTEEERECGRNPPKLGFLTDDDGNPVIEARIKTFISTAKQAWNELYRLWLDPSSWTKKTPKAASYLTYILKRNFDEFCYCDGDWKVEHFAIVKYPDWCHDGRKLGHLTHVWCLLLTTFVLGARPSKCKTGDVKLLQQKKAKVKLTAPPGTQVIDLAHDAPASSNTLCSTTNLTSAPVTTTFNPSSPSASIPASIPYQKSLTSTTLSVSAIYISCSPSHSSQTATQAISAQFPTHSDAMFSSSNLSASDPGASTCMQGQKSDTCHIESEISRLSSGDPSLSKVPALVPSITGVLTDLKSDFALMLITQLYHCRHHQT